MPLHDLDNIAQCCATPRGGHGEGRPNLGRLVGEWTLAFDQAPSLGLEMYTWYDNPAANPGLHMPPARRAFLRDFAEAQMVAFERTAPVEHEIVGWFFWNFKMEPAIYVEWSYLDGVRNGWIPKLPRGNAGDARRAEEIFGSCVDIRDRQENDTSFINPYPPWEGDGFLREKDRAAWEASDTRVLLCLLLLAFTRPFGE